MNCSKEERISDADIPILSLYNKDSEIWNCNKIFGRCRNIFLQNRMRLKKIVENNQEAWKTSVKGCLKVFFAFHTQFQNYNPLFFVFLQEPILLLFLYHQIDMDKDLLFQVF